MRNLSLPTKVFVLFAITTLGYISTPYAQTMLESTAQMAPPLPPVMPVSNSVVKQAKDQINGDFGYMDRASVGGQIQSVWNDTIPSEGVFEYNLCEACVYKVRVREFMVTSVVLPKGVKIHSFDVGDSAKFQVKKRADNILAIQPAGGGLDTSMQVYTKSGEVFPFYLRAESFNSKNVPDLVVKIKTTGLQDHPVISTKSISQGDTDETLAPMSILPDEKSDALEGMVSQLAPYGGDKGPSGGATTDFIKSATFDPDKLHGWGDYKLWGDEKLRPVSVFRDDHFTYIQFGDKWTDIELPTAYVVIDEIDELVNTRIQGRTYIVENTSELITLKSGKSFMCIQYGGKA